MARRRSCLTFDRAVPVPPFAFPGSCDVVRLAGNGRGRYLALMAAGLTVLGIETSCDETAVAVVCDTPRPAIRANLIRSQIAEHAPYGGVVPEIAARAHLAHIEGLVRRAMAEAEIGFDGLDGIAAASGPGLIGGLIVGAMAAKGLAWAAGKPFVAVNHLEAHALAARLAPGVEFPYLLLLVSGGHTQLLACAGVGRYRQLGTSRDDAAGEAFDKTAKLLGLGYPGGPAIERAARDGDPRRFALPRPLKGRAGLRFLVLRAEDRGAAHRGRHGRARRPDRPAGCLPILPPSVEAAICDTLADRTANAIAWFRRDYPAGTALVAAGGVAANARLRRRLAELAGGAGLDFVAPPPALCTDNGAMIAWAGIERLRLGLTDGLDAPVRPRWPLDEDIERGGAAFRPSGRARVKRLAVIGGGAWGTALAAVGGAGRRRVVLWARDPALAEAVNRNHANPVYLPGIALDPAIVATTDPETARLARGCRGGHALIVVPAQFLRAVASRLAPLCRRACRCCSAPRGSRRSRSRRCRKSPPTIPASPLAVLSGPSFAAEAARGLPTAVTIASRDPALAGAFVAALGSARFRPYSSDDPIGVEIGGAVKNVLAIACGIVEGRGLGDNARAALITRGLAEMVRLGIAKGAERGDVSRPLRLGDRS